MKKKNRKKKIGKKKHNRTMLFTDVVQMYPEGKGVTH